MLLLFTAGTGFDSFDGLMQLLHIPCAGRGRKFDILLKQQFEHHHHHLFACRLSLSWHVLEQ